MKKNNKIVWMDIPVENLERATKFYSGLMATEFSIEEFGNTRFALCPHSDDESAFCLSVVDKFQVTPQNVSLPLIYLNVNGRMEDALNEVNRLGGKILENINQIGPYGFRAIIIDSENNKIALHSQS